MRRRIEIEAGGAGVCVLFGARSEGWFDRSAGPDADFRQSRPRLRVDSIADGLVRSKARLRVPCLVLCLQLRSSPAVVVFVGQQAHRCACSQNAFVGAHKASKSRM